MHRTERREVDAKPGLRDTAERSTDSEATDAHAQRGWQAQPSLGAKDVCAHSQRDAHLQERRVHVHRPRRRRLQHRPADERRKDDAGHERLNVRSDGAEILVISGSLNGAPSLVPSLGGLGAPRTSANRTVVSTFSPLWRMERDRMRRTSYACSTFFFSDSLDEEASFLFFFFRMMSNEDASFSVRPSKRSASGKEIVDEEDASSETCGGESSLESDDPESPDGTEGPPGEQ